MEGVKTLIALVTATNGQLARATTDNDRLALTCKTLEENGNALAENMELNIRTNQELERELESALEELNHAKEYIETRKNSPKKDVNVKEVKSNPAPQVSRRSAPSPKRTNPNPAPALPPALATDNSTASLLAQVGSLIGKPISPTAGALTTAYNAAPKQQYNAKPVRYNAKPVQYNVAPVRANSPTNDYSDKKYEAITLKPFQSPPPVQPTPNNTPLPAQMKSPPKSPPRIKEAPNVGGAQDPNLPAKKLLMRLNKYTVDNNIDMNRQWRLMDINGDGFLSFDELYEAMKTLGLEVAFSDVLILHKYLAGDEELVSLHNFFKQVQTPPEVEKRKDFVVPKAGTRKAVKNIDLDNVHGVETGYEYSNGGFVAQVANPSLLQPTQGKSLGDLASNPNRRRSQEVREGGWMANSQTAKQADGTFGNVFEYQAIEERDEHRKMSTFMMEGAHTKLLPACPKEVTNVFGKIAAYVKNHNIMIQEMRAHLDVHRDGKLNAADLKKQIITKIGVHLSVAESNFIYKYLSGVSGGDYILVADLEAAIVQHKPKKGGYRLK